MGTQVLDAFLVTFGIDTKPLERDEREVRRRTDGLKDSTKRTFDDMEVRGKSLGLTFRNVRNELAGMLLLFTGGKSMLDFATGMIRSEAQAGRLGATIGVTTSRLIAWQQAVKGVGGAPGEADSALQTAARWKMDWKLSPQNVPQAELARLGINANDLERASPDELLMKLSAARSRMRATEFANLLQRVGLPQSVIFLLDQGTKRLREQIDEHERNANVTEKDSKAAQEFQDKLAKLDSFVQGTLRPTLSGLIDQFINVVTWLDKNNALAPLVVTALGAIAIAAVAATGPWSLLAGAIGAAVLAWKDFNALQNMSKAEQDAFDKRGAELREKAWDQLKRGDISGFLGTIGEGFTERMDHSLNGKPWSGGSAGTPIPQNGPVSDLFNVLERELGTERARGIWAGIGAESGWDPNAKNPTSGAYGLGQWLGSRKKELFRRYGTNPTAAQQMEYLIWELKGGDRGGSKVLGTTTADHALLAYITSFMRPAAGAETTGDIARGRQYLYGRGSASRSSGDVNIQTMTIQTQATDAQGIARDMHGALKARNIVTQTDAGVAP
ncbi:phage tail tip lysozyme [Sphingomonas sp. VL_57B]|jgi:hypothetical protein|uniref:phage tail tip lysozyme n=1 Tax=Sphingomonas sp. VL_57B TaxID=3144220 RepID=UPI0031F58A9C